MPQYEGDALRILRRGVSTVTGCVEHSSLVGIAADRVRKPLAARTLSQESSTICIAPVSYALLSYLVHISSLLVPRVEFMDK